MVSKIETVKQKQLKDDVPSFEVGNTVKVHVRIREGEKERIQLFTGTVIGRDGTGATETFTVRRMSQGVGVERVFPVHSPHIAKLEVISEAHVRRAKLYFLRDRVGKKTRLPEKHRRAR